MREKGIRFYGYGGFTLESLETSGTPNEFYAIGTQKEVPDIVIEVIGVPSGSRGRLDKKELYKPKQVPEVWFWQKGQVMIFHLGKQGYEQRDRSEFFSDLDLAVLQHYLDYPDQYDAVTDLINGIRQGKP